MLKDYLVFNEVIHEFSIMYGGKKIVIPSPTQLIKYAQMIDDTFMHPKYAENGTSIHAMTELVDDGVYVPEIVDGTVHSAIVGYEQFLLEHDVEWTITEEKIFNDELFYAGIMDRLGIVDEEEFIVDIKSGNKYRWHIIQLAFYHLAQGASRVADLYLGGCSYKFHVWSQKELDEACDIVRTICKLYWYNHPRNYKQLLKLKETI